MIEIEGSILNPLLPNLHETDILYYHPLGLHTVTMHYRIRSTVTRAVNAILRQLEPEYWTRFSSHTASLACARPTKSTPKSVSDGFHHNISAFYHMRHASASGQSGFCHRFFTQKSKSRIHWQNRIYKI